MLGMWYPVSIWVLKFSATMNSKRTLYLRVDVDAPADTDPMLDLSDVATWAECRLNHALKEAQISTQVTAYASAEDIVRDEAEAKKAVPSCI